MKLRYPYFKNFLLAMIMFFAETAVFGAPPISLEYALNCAFESSLALKQAEANVQMKLAECWQAGLRPNPELSVGADSLAGRGNNLGFNSSGPFATISQVFELGNKRSARQNAAAAVAYTAMWDREILRQEIAHKVTDLIIDAAALNAKVNLLRLSNENALDSLACLAERVKNGKATYIQQKQNELALSSTKITLKKAESELASILQELALVCSCSIPPVDQINYPFFDVAPPPPFNNYANALSNNPEVSKYHSMLFASSENYHLQRANAIPNLEVTAGVCRDNDSRHNSFCFELSIPLPIFDRNQGNISKSCWETQATAYLLKEVETRLKMSCAKIHEQWVKTFESIVSLQNDSLPASQEILNICVEGNQQGKYDCLDILGAQSRQIDFKIQLVEALKEFHHLKADLQFLCGSCF